MRKLIYILVLLFFTSLYSCSKNVGYEEGQIAPSFKLKIEDKGEVYIFPNKSKDATFILFGFPGCAYCRRTINRMHDYMEKHKNDKRLDFLFVKILDSSGEYYTKDNFYVLKGDKKIKEMFNVKKTPTVIIVDKNGKIVDRSIGYEDGQEEKYIRILNELLGESNEDTTATG